MLLVEKTTPLLIFVLCATYKRIRKGLVYSLNISIERKVAFLVYNTDQSVTETLSADIEISSLNDGSAEMLY